VWVRKRSEQVCIGFPFKNFIQMYPQSLGVGNFKCLIQYKLSCNCPKHSACDTSWRSWLWHFLAHCSLGSSLSSSRRLAEVMELTGYQHSLNSIVLASGMDMDLANLRTQPSGLLYSPDELGSSHQNNTVPWPNNSTDPLILMAMQSQIRGEDKTVMNNDPATCKEPSWLSQEGLTCLNPTTCQLVHQDVPMLSLPNALDISFKPWPLAHIEDTILRTDPSAVASTNSSVIGMHRDATTEKEKDFSMITMPNSCHISSDPCPFMPMQVTTPENDCSTMNPQDPLTCMKAATSEEGSSMTRDMSLVCCFNRILSCIGDRFSQELTKITPKAVFRHPLIGCPFPHPLQVHIFFTPSDMSVILAGKYDNPLKSYPQQSSHVWVYGCGHQRDGTSHSEQCRRYTQTSFEQDAKWTSIQDKRHKVPSNRNLKKWTVRAIALDSKVLLQL